MTTRLALSFDNCISINYHVAMTKRYSIRTFLATLEIKTGKHYSTREVGFATKISRPTLSALRNGSAQSINADHHFRLVAFARNAGWNASESDVLEIVESDKQ